MGFGSQLRLARERAGLSQVELAERADISIDSIQNWEQGRTRPRLPALGKLAAALGVSLDVLVMGGEDSPNAQRARGRPKKAEGPAVKPVPPADRKPAGGKAKSRKAPRLPGSVQ